MNKRTLPTERVFQDEDWRIPLPEAFTVESIHTMSKKQLLGLQQLALW